MIYGVIYKITCKLNWMIYVGQTKRSLKKRITQHCYKGKKDNSYIDRALQKYGLENFIVEVIEECETREQLNKREKFWIAALNCKYPNGYNLKDGGANGAGYHHTVEAREKMSEKRKGHACSPETRAKIGAKSKGRKLSSEAIAKAVVARKGYIPTPETRMNLSKSHKKNIVYPVLEAELEERQITWVGLGKMLGVSKGLISAKLRGARKLNLATAIRIKEVLGVDMPLEELFAKATAQQSE